jgi:hypothetical protein
MSYSYFRGLQPQVFYVRLPPDAQQKLVILKFPRFGLAPHCRIQQEWNYTDTDGERDR